MEQTKWFLEQETEGVDVGGHKYGSGDSGAPMLCSLVCKSMGRHVHVTDCVAGERGQCAGGPEVEHITTTRVGGVKDPMDWVSHNLYWKKSGSWSNLQFLAITDLSQVSKVQRIYSNQRFYLSMAF